MCGYLHDHKHPATGQVSKGEEFSFTIQLPVVPMIEMRSLIPSFILGSLLAGSYASVVPWVLSVMDGWMDVCITSQLSFPSPALAFFLLTLP